jgi:hypothetical protein
VLGKPSQPSFDKLLRFLTRLEQTGAPYLVKHSRPEAIVVVTGIAEQYWEVEFFDDGHVEIERFYSDAQIDGDERLLDDLVGWWEGDDAAANRLYAHHRSSFKDGAFEG